MKKICWYYKQIQNLQFSTKYNQQNSCDMGILGTRRTRNAIACQSMLQTINTLQLQCSAYFLWKHQPIYYNKPHHYQQSQNRRNRVCKFQRHNSKYDTITTWRPLAWFNSLDIQDNTYPKIKDFTNIHRELQGNHRWKIREILVFIRVELEQLVFMV